MKSSDAKNPKFESAWWKTNKAKAADADGGLEKLLKQYETLRKELTASTKGTDGFPLASASKIGKTLFDIKAEAAKKAKDPKLGVMQKETKDALAAYEKKADAGMKVVQQFANSPLMKMKTPELVRHAPQFRTYAGARHAQENVDFLMAMNDKKFNLATYERFISSTAPDQINIDDSVRSQFDAVAQDVKATPPVAPDSPQTWQRAPWKAAVDEIVRMSEQNFVTKFRCWATAQHLSKQLP